MGFTMTSDYRAKLYRLIFGLAAIYNFAFGLWACLWPRSFFDSVEIASPNYPALWSCLGMVIGLYGVLYAYAAYRIDRAAPIISVGLAGKILGPIGWLMVINSGEWPLRTFTLIVFNDLIWWLPFGLFLLDETRSGKWLRHITPWACATINALAALVMLFALRGGTEAISSFAERATYIAEHVVLWRTIWAIWMAAAVSLVAFFAWWGAWIRSTRWGIVACVVAILGWPAIYSPNRFLSVGCPLESKLSRRLARCLLAVRRTVSTRSLASFLLSAHLHSTGCCAFGHGRSGRAASR